LSGAETEAQYFNWDDQFGRAYLCWTPHKIFALTAEYQYERFDRRENPFQQEIVDLTTHRVALGSNFFHPSGITFRLKPPITTSLETFRTAIQPRFSQGGTIFGYLMQFSNIDCPSATVLSAWA
jgi:hypothetical protein